MARAVRKHWCLLGLIAVFIVGVPFAAQAQYYTKFYDFTNATAAEQQGMKAHLIGWEYLTSAYNSPWGTVGYNPLDVQLGVGVTSIWSPNPSGTGSGVPVGGSAQIGWTTWDMNCYLWDMYWTDGAGNPSEGIIPNQLVGMPGGGSAVWDGTDLTWTIENTLLQPPPDGGGDLGPAASVDWPQRPDIHLPTELDVWVLDDSMSLDQLSHLLGGPFRYMGNGGYESIGVTVPPDQYIDLLGLDGVLGPGESFSFTVPDVGAGQSVLLMGPILQDQQIGVYVEQVTPTSEPCTLVLLGCTGLPLLGRLRRRRR